MAGFQGLRGSRPGFDLYEGDQIVIVMCKNLVPIQDHL